MKYCGIDLHSNNAVVAVSDKQDRVRTTPGLNGDFYQALRSIRARTLVLAGVGDLLNPEPEALEVARYVHGAQFESIEPRWPSGHFSAAGVTQPEVDFQNREIGAFLTNVAAQAHPG